MNCNSNRIRVVATLAAAAMLTLLLVSCGDGGPLDVRAAEPSKESVSRTRLTLRWTALKALPITVKSSL